MQEITLQPRSCECCGGNDLEQVFQSKSTIKRTSDTWLFPYFIAVCKSCGFSFNSPGPKHEDLVRYHTDGISGYKQIGLPYSIDLRISVLQKYSVPKGIFAEIGGDQPGEFHQRCAPLFRKQVAIDISDDISTEIRSVNDLEQNSVDVIAHYDVLEHVTEVKEFLSACYRALKPDGVMICEVPDIRLYPRNLLMQEFEHVNHFSVSTLSSIAIQVGLNPVEFSHNCSRPYGFLAVYRKGKISAPENWTPFEYIDAMACLNGGKEQIRLCNENIDLIRQQLKVNIVNKKKITIWGVTDLLLSLVDDFALLESIVVVDSDPRRKDHLLNKGIFVHQPKNVIEHIKSSDVLVICAPRYKAEIVEWVFEHTGKNFLGESLVVMGTGLSGETLR